MDGKWNHFGSLATVIDLELQVGPKNRGSWEELRTPWFCWDTPTSDSLNLKILEIYLKVTWKCTKISLYNHICIYDHAACANTFNCFFFCWVVSVFFHTCYGTSLHVWSNMREADAGKIEPLSNQQLRESPSEQWSIHPRLFCYTHGGWYTMLYRDYAKISHEIRVFSPQNEPISRNISCFMSRLATRYKWSYNPCKWPLQMGNWGF